MVRVLTFEEYGQLPHSSRSALSDYYAREACAAGGLIYGLFDGGALLSYLILCLEGAQGTISFVWTDESHRGKRYATELVKEVIEKIDVVYLMHIVTSHPEYKAILAIVKHAGFSAYSASSVFTYKTDVAMWARMDEIPLDRMREMLLSGNRKCLSFNELSQGEVDQLEYSQSGEFGNTLNPGEFVRSSAKALDWGLSFALFEGGMLKAYSLVTRPRRSHVVVEQIAAADDVRGTGYIIAPLSMTLEKIREDEVVEKMTMTIADVNAASKNFLFSMLKGVDREEERSICFYYKKHSAR